MWIAETCVVDNREFVKLEKTHKFKSFFDGHVAALDYLLKLRNARVHDVMCELAKADAEDPLPDATAISLPKRRRREMADEIAKIAELVFKDIEGNSSVVKVSTTYSLANVV